MSILDEREEYLKNPYFKEHEYGDFTPFYVTVAFCAVLGGFLFILNIVFCWCSRHREYWQNRHSGESDIPPIQPETWLHSSLLRARPTDTVSLIF